MKTVTLHTAAIIYEDSSSLAVMYCIDGKPAHLMLKDGYEQTPSMVDHVYTYEHFTSFNTMDTDELIHSLFCTSDKVWSWAY